MKKNIAKTKNTMQRASCLLVPDDLLVLVGLPGAQPELRPVPVRAKRVYRYNK